MSDEAREAAYATAEIRQRANSYDGVPNDVFDRWIVEHDRAIHAAGVREGLEQARAALEDVVDEFEDTETEYDAGVRDALRLIDSLISSTAALETLGRASGGA